MLSQFLLNTIDFQHRYFLSASTLVWRQVFSALVLQDSLDDL
jgi:hypothetical protein